MRTIALLFAISFAVPLLAGSSLHQDTNLAQWNFPDVTGLNIKPYDQRIYEAGKTMDGSQCCQRDMYRVDGKKVVLLSHQGTYFLAIVIDKDQSHMYFAEQPGRFVELPVEKGARWKIPDWLSASAVIPGNSENP